MRPVGMNFVRLTGTLLADPGTMLGEVVVQ